MVYISIVFDAFLKLKKPLRKNTEGFFLWDALHNTFCITISCQKFILLQMCCARPTRLQTQQYSLRVEDDSQ